MSTNQAVRSNLVLANNPQQVGPSLAHVICYEAGRENILGQAWLAAPNKLVTCGHVVDQFAQSPQAVSVRFPASNNTYQVLEIKLHPSFVRQPDGLVKFDVAVLIVDLDPPESQTPPLPFSYEHDIKVNESLSTIRYPVHLGQLSAALQPLTQDGKFRGLLRKHDNFHLLHDLPLAPGDSGAPICLDKRVVAIHCGDTATIPGLNLPTTSIRLALWVDALRELGLSETRGFGLASGKTPLGIGLVAMLIAATVAFYGGASLWPKPKTESAWSATPPPVAPIEIVYERKFDTYKFEQPFELSAVPSSDCYLYVFFEEPSGIDLLFPESSDALQKSLEPAKDSKLLQASATTSTVIARAGESVRIDHINGENIKAATDETKIHLLAFPPSFKQSSHLTYLFPADRWAFYTDPKTQKTVSFLRISKEEFAKRIDGLSQENSGKFIYWTGPGPLAKKKEKNILQNP